MLNRVIQDAVTRTAPPVVGLKPLKIYYGTMTETAPPRFILFISRQSRDQTHPVAFVTIRPAVGNTAVDEDGHAFEVVVGQRIVGARVRLTVSAAEVAVDGAVVEPVAAVGVVIIPCRGRVRTAGLHPVAAAVAVSGGVERIQRLSGRLGVDVLTVRADFPVGIQRGHGAGALDAEDR
ncbi:MAG: hypothetical protein IKH12_03100 [Clostridia bacterium]|nr:hypothetical protein [Clostridia bacterium]